MVTPRLFLHFHGVGAGDLSRSPALWVSDLQLVLCRSIVDRSIVCRPLVLPLSSFFFLSTDFSLPPFDFPPVLAPHESLSGSLGFFFEFYKRLQSASLLLCPVSVHSLHTVSFVILQEIAVSISSFVSAFCAFSAHSIICDSTRDCSQHLFFCVRFLCILCTQYHLWFYKRLQSASLLLCPVSVHSLHTVSFVHSETWWPWVRQCEQNVVNCFCSLWYNLAVKLFTLSDFSSGLGERLWIEISIPSGNALISCQHLLPSPVWWTNGVGI